MVSSSKLHLLDFIVNSLIDIVLLVAMEFLIKCIFSTNVTAAAESFLKQISMFSVQISILLVSSVVLYVFHHTPYLLGFITAFILLRLLFVIVKRRNGERVYADRFVSQPIKHGNLAVRNNRMAQQVGHASSMPQGQQHQYTTPVGEHPQTGFRQRSVSKENQPIQTSLNQQQKSVVLFKSPTVDVVKSGLHSSLQRSPLISSTSQLSSNIEASSISSSSCGAQSFLGQNFGYISSLFRRRETNTTPSGMFNLGNTCFINSTLQCLIWTNGFIESLPYLFSSQIYNNSTRLVRVLDDVVNLCRAFPDSGNDYKPVNVTELLRSISLVAPHLVAMPDTDAYQTQQDAAEFLLWLLNHLHGILRVQSGGKSGLDIILSNANISDLTRSKQACLSMLQKSKSTHIPLLREPLTNLSEVDWQLHWQEDSSTLYQLFLGQLIEARECQMCGKMSFSIEYFTVLPLPIPTCTNVNDNQHYTLGDCFKLFSSPEDMTQSNMITCSCVGGSSDSLTPGKRLTLLSRPSKRLVIQLSRYSYDNVQGMAVKSTVSVLFPLVLDLFPHTMSSTLGDSQHVKSMVYDLQGFCVHSGAQSTSYGHYIAYCKTTTEKWYYFNDEQVSLVDNIEAELNSTFVLQNAYLLFYSERSN